MNAPASLLRPLPRNLPPLDPDFRPIALGNRAYRALVARSPARTPLVFALEREKGAIAGFRTEVLPFEGGHADETLRYAERLLKFLLWQKGAHRVVIGGPRELGERLKAIYGAGGGRDFDFHFMGRIYERAFSIELTDAESAPVAKEAAVPLGGRLDGCRLGLDLGASDFKLAAVVDGEPVFTEEIPWDPKIQPDPEWHYRKINEGLRLAASKMPRVDALGVSAAGVYIDNRVRVASLFRAVPEALFNEKVTPLFERMAREWKVPVEVANDGDVTALAGGMSLRQTNILGCAMGSSEAVGFLNDQGRITGWLNELAFAPVDYNPNAAVEEWSGDRGVGALYFSQQAVARLAPAAGIALPDAHQAEQLKIVQALHEKGDGRARKIFETIGVYLGYTMAWYSDMYANRHLLILGRVTSGKGGDVILQEAQKVMKEEFPELADSVKIHTPDEKMKRVGQAVAAASLPVIS